MVGSPRKIRLKTRFMVATATVLLPLTVIIVLLVGNRLTRSMEQEAQSHALAVAQSIAIVSTNALLTYDYVTLEQNAKQALKISEHAYVMATGQIKMSGKASELMEDPMVQKAYLGEH